MISKLMDGSISLFHPTATQNLGQALTNPFLWASFQLIWKRASTSVKADLKLQNELTQEKKSIIANLPHHLQFVLNLTLKMNPRVYETQTKPQHPKSSRERMSNKPYHPPAPQKPAYRADYPILKNQTPPTASEEVLEPECQSFSTFCRGFLSAF